MALLTKPNMQQVWASGGDIVEPSDLKKQQGWTVEVPPHQFENWIQNRQDEYLAHINQRGIPAWDGLTNYEAGGLSYVQGSDGKVYKSVAASGPATTTQDPTTDVSDTYWTVAFADVGVFLTQAAGDTRYTQRANNLSDLTNVATARTNLSVYGTTQTYTKAEVDSKTTVASTAQAQAGVSNVVLMTPLRTEEWGTSNVIGMGQTLQNVIGSRVPGVTYTNSTGKPIFVYIDTSTVSNFSVNGVKLFDSAGDGLCVIIPTGSTYTLQAGAGTDSWWEFR